MGGEKDVGQYKGVALFLLSVTLLYPTREKKALPLNKPPSSFPTIYPSQDIWLL